MIKKDKTTLEIDSGQMLKKGAYGENLLTALYKNGIFLWSDCSGNGTCGKCWLSVYSIDSQQTHKRLACQTKLAPNTIIRIPETSLETSIAIDKGLLQLPGKYRINTEKDDRKDKYSLAVDLGTTTIGIYLVNSVQRQYISGVSFKNPQRFFGSDVISRISTISKSKTALSDMQGLTIKAIENHLTLLLEKHNLSFSQLETMTVAGNPTMIHILLKEDPRTIGVFPYHPRFTSEKKILAGELGFTKRKDLPLYTLPLVSGFLGSDILSAASAVNFNELPTGALLMDLGTNGELLLKGKKQLFAASCATGPAFEGACLSCGMTAIPGAIYHVECKDSFTTPTIRIVGKNNGGDVKASGICGAGAISAISSMLKAGIIKPDGRFGECSSQSNLAVHGADKRYTLVQPELSATKNSIYISQKDIRALQMAKAAVAAGIEVLCNHAGIENVTQTFIAGAFGNYVNSREMTAIGMLPRINSSDIKTVGNAAGTGAVLTLLDEGYIYSLYRIKDLIKVVDLTVNHEFEKLFISALRLSPMD